MQQETHDIAVEALKGAPAVAGAVASALTLNQWVMLSTAIYIILQALYLLRKWWREEADREYEKARKVLENAREDEDWEHQHQHQHQHQTGGPKC